MKNLLHEIKKCAQNKYTKSYLVEKTDCDETGKVAMWVLLNLVEGMQDEPLKCLAKTSAQYKKDLKQVSLQLYNPAHEGDKLELEARFYEVDRRNVELKVFVRKVKPDKSTKRICRASYFFQAVFDSEAAA